MRALMLRRQRAPRNLSEHLCRHARGASLAPTLCVAPRLVRMRSESFVVTAPAGAAESAVATVSPRGGDVVGVDTVRCPKAGACAE